MIDIEQAIETVRRMNDVRAVRKELWSSLLPSERESHPLWRRAGEELGALRERLLQ